MFLYLSVTSHFHSSISKLFVFDMEVMFSKALVCFNSVGLCLPVCNINQQVINRLR